MFRVSTVSRPQSNSRTFHITSIHANASLAGGLREQRFGAVLFRCLIKAARISAGVRLPSRIAV